MNMYSYSNSCINRAGLACLRILCYLKASKPSGVFVDTNPGVCQFSSVDCGACPFLSETSVSNFRGFAQEETLALDCGVAYFRDSARGRHFALGCLRG